MPQPLSRVAPNGLLIFGNAAQRPFLERPNLGIMYAEAIVSCARVEAFMLRMCMELVGGHDSTDAAKFASLQGDRAKQEAIRTAIATKLCDRRDDQDLFEAIQSLLSTNQKERNRLVHWVWGEVKGRHDILICVDPRIGPDDSDPANILVYTEHDFRKFTESNDLLSGHLQRFEFILADHVANRDGKIYRALCAIAEIAERLETVRRKRGI